MTIEVDRNYFDKLVEDTKRNIPMKCKMFVDTCKCGYRVYPHMAYCSQCGQALEWENKKA